MFHYLSCDSHNDIIVIEDRDAPINTNLKDERIPIRRKSFLEKNGSFKISTQDRSAAMASMGMKKIKFHR